MPPAGLSRTIFVGLAAAEYGVEPFLAGRVSLLI
jgi:hypothetical protein